MYQRASNDVHGWLAASPDGLISLQAGAATDLSATEAQWLQQQTGTGGCNGFVNVLMCLLCLHQADHDGA
jgi:hypothetical protein